MTINKTREGDKMTAKLGGRIDVKGAAELSAALTGELEGLSELLLDFTDVEYLASAGLRVILMAQDHFEQTGGKLTIRGCNSVVVEVFEITGFSEFLNLE